MATSGHRSFVVCEESFTAAATTIKSACDYCAVARGNAALCPGYGRCRAIVHGIWTSWRRQPPPSDRAS